MKRISLFSVFLTSSILFSVVSQGSDLISEFKADEHLNLSIRGRATAKGAIVTVMLNSDFVRSKLPKGLELVPFKGVPQHQHPVILYIGQQSGLTAIIGGSAEMSIATRYAEITFGITNVRIRNSGSQHVYTHLTDIRLNSWPAIWMGWMVGFSKKPGVFILGRTSVLGVTKDGSHLVEANFNRPDTYDRKVFARNTKFLAASLQPLIVQQKGKFRCIDFDWRFDEAVMSPVAVNVSLYKSFIGGDFLDLSSKGLDEDPFGSLTIDTNWSMSNPRACD